MRPPNTKIFISGPNFLQNTLLAELLAQEMQIECTCHPSLTLIDLIDEDKNQTCVCLFDCCDCDLIEIDKRLNTGAVICPDNLLPVLFNVTPSSNVETLVRQNLIRGIFYRKDTHSVFSKGIRKILSGELWLRRQMLARCILHPMAKESAACLCIPWLSQRENQVLHLLTTGASNREIAAKMYVSLNTVKTHLYNIYKKIGVPNRLQAAIFAANYRAE